MFLSALQKKITKVKHQYSNYLSKYMKKINYINVQKVHAHLFIHAYSYKIQ